MHSYIDPKDNIKKSSDLLRDCRQFIELQQFYDALNPGANIQTYPMIQGAPAPNMAPQVQPQQQLQIQQRAPEAFPPPEGQMSMIQRSGFSKRELKKFTREVNLVEASMANIPEYIN